jgi:hypothetical protein
MANDNLTGNTISSTYNQLLITADTGGITGADASTTQIHCGGATAGAGNADTTPLYLSTTRVGIGKTAPAYELHIADTSTSCYVKIETVSGSEAGVIFDDQDQKWTIGVDGATSGTADVFVISAATGFGTERLAISPAGNVGIGTTAPAAFLHVKSGTSSITPYTGAELILEAAAAENYINFLASAGSSSGNGLVWSDTSGGNEAYLYYQHSIDSLVIGGAGKVGIGSAGPSYKLHVEDTQSASFVGMFKNASTNVGADCLRLLIMTAAGDATTGNKWLSCEDAANPNEYLLRGDGSGGIEVYDSSDRRLKENIIDISDALSMINNLKPRRYNRKGFDSSKYKYGFIADEFVSVFPNSVGGTTDGTRLDDDGNTVPDYQTISTKNLSGVLTKAIQELSAKVTALENA